MPKHGIPGKKILGKKKKRKGKEKELHRNNFWEKSRYQQTFEGEEALGIILALVGRKFSISHLANVDLTLCSIRNTDSRGWRKEGRKEDDRAWRVEG